MHPSETEVARKTKLGWEVIMLEKAKDTDEFGSESIRKELHSSLRMVVKTAPCKDPWK